MRSRTSLATTRRTSRLPRKRRSGPAPSSQMSRASRSRTRPSPKHRHPRNRCNLRRRPSCTGVVADGVVGTRSAVSRCPMLRSNRSRPAQISKACVSSRSRRRGPRPRRQRTTKRPNCRARGRRGAEPAAAEDGPSTLRSRSPRSRRGRRARPRMWRPAPVPRKRRSPRSARSRLRPSHLRWRPRRMLSGADVADIFERIRKGHEEGPAQTTDDAGTGSVTRGSDAAPPEPADAAVSEEEGQLASLFERRDAAVDEVGRRVAKRLKRRSRTSRARCWTSSHGRGSDRPPRSFWVIRPSSSAPAPRRCPWTSGASAVGVALAGDLHDGAIDHPSIELDPVAEEVAAPSWSRCAPAWSAPSVRVRWKTTTIPPATRSTPSARDRIRACYREWRGPRLTVAVTDACASAFGLGLRAALPEAVGLRWFTDRGDKPCPDCDDNGLAGVVAGASSSRPGSSCRRPTPGAGASAPTRGCAAFRAVTPRRVALDPARGVMSVSR